MCLTTLLSVVKYVSLAKRPSAMALLLLPLPPPPAVSRILHHSLGLPMAGG